MDINLSSDQPVKKAEEDKFQRYNFSKRIADTIKNRKSEECIVVGIYGSWGEGKTSVLNFIETEMEQDKAVVMVKFNPWRYQDENMLLMQFFNKLAASVDANVKNTSEKAGAFLKRYSKAVNFDIPVIGNIGEALKGVGELLDGEDPEQLKAKVNKIIKDTGKKFIVVIDDIDRLDKNEIHAIFRLVKLTADFANTTYVLSFDEKMVAAAIGDRFGEGDIVAGMNFLEKIIQVPLRIPIVKREAIEIFCMEQIQEILDVNKIELEDIERQRFIGNFIRCILPKLLTPRIAGRYSNTLTFSLPLMKGEVNMVDLMLIEALKIFYPNFYNYVRFNPAIFADPEFKIETDNFSARDSLIAMEKNLKKSELAAMRFLLMSLFPNSVFYKEQNYIERKLEPTPEEAFYQMKSIASVHYFERYFSYDVTKGDLSDLVAVNLIKKINSLGEADWKQALTDIFKRYPAAIVMRKLNSYFATSTAAEKERLLIALGSVSRLFSKLEEERVILGMDSMVYFFNMFENLIVEQEKKEDARKKVEAIIAHADPAEFIIEVANAYTRGMSRTAFPLDDQDIKDLQPLVIERCFAVSTERLLVDGFPRQLVRLLPDWKRIDEDGLNRYLTKYLKMDDKLHLKIIKGFIRGETTHKDMLYDLQRSDYDKVVAVLDKEKINDSFLKLFAANEVSQEPKWAKIKGQPNFEQTDLNIARQFMHHYENKPVPGPPKLK